jgi:hypothetical protein
VLGQGGRKLMGRLWQILKGAFSGYLANDALSRGAAIAFYAATSLAPLLLIVVAIAGLVFGQDAARGAISEALGQLLGPTGGDFIKSILERSSDPGSGALTTILGVITVPITASGVFGEMHTALNATFKAKPIDEPISALIRTRAASLGLAAALGFAGGVAGGERRPVRAGLFLPRAVRRQDPVGRPQHRRLARDLQIAVHRDLQGASRHGDTLARTGSGRVRHGRAVRRRKIADRNLSRPRGAQFALRRSRRADRPDVLDVLFGSDIPLRR